MAQATTDRVPTLPNPRLRKSLDVTRHDQASSILVALLVTLGIVVFLMFFAWLSSRIRYETPTLPVEVVEGLGDGGGGGGTGTAPGPEQMLEDVSSDEVPALQEQNAEQGLEAVAAAVSIQVSNIENFDELAEGGGGIGGGSGGGIGMGVGTGIGDGRGPGRGGKPGGQLPEWEVRFNASTIEIYSQQLDFFNVELAAIGGGKNVIDYASKFTQPQPAVRSGSSTQEKRRYLTWRKGPLAAADKQLLAKAGIDTSARIVLQFLPFEVEQQMAQLELEYARGKKMSQIRRTVFAVRGSEGKFEFYVVEQEDR